ncbi:hypothetical protein DLAC_06342 [Tieghemostelium lacteum]|uniref:Calcineurin-like phosphoesterase domain-containing protein n=1 Tax=Tieghemostelium lacteum TaxID=361077 RepID=A0A151ZEL8_TIELA|nr:hypothetical protein DLAC_06342 [Tieghemostelium lacteum]|eukprot:KYQ92375.1 hypothetical protein DLAC_06342 [Tieghemostelium lacteum]
MPTLHRDTQPISLVQISDIHYDHHPIRISDNFMTKVIATVNNLKPDIVVITGDLVQCDPEPIHDLLNKHLSKINSKYGIYCILGNHDYKKEHGSQYIKDVLANSNIKLLVNEVCWPFGRGDGKLQLSGLGDMNKRRNDFNLEPIREDLLDPNTPRLVLSHNPDSHVKFKEFNVDLILSGHTHGGQICLPNGKPIIPILDRFVRLIPKRILTMVSYPRGVVKNWELASGLIKLRDLPSNSSTTSSNPPRSSYIYVNRGLATHPPLRLFCDPEITHITLLPHSP